MKKLFYLLAGLMFSMPFTSRGQTSVEHDRGQIGTVKIRQHVFTTKQLIARKRSKAASKARNQ